MNRMMIAPVPSPERNDFVTWHKAPFGQGLCVVPRVCAALLRLSSRPVTPWRWAISMTMARPIASPRMRMIETVRVALRMPLPTVVISPPHRRQSEPSSGRHSTRHG
ncbi:MAG TPA: hypothetical protein DHU96_22745 [Actinobacteria bacterium]|nr:hypothetical protein [Actinomycetota bacterium]